VPLQRIRPAVEVLEKEIGVDHALASKRLYTDGAEVLFDYANRRGEREVMDLVVGRTQQRQFSGVVKDYLKRIHYGGGGWADSVRLPTYGSAQVVVDPKVAFGLPFVVHGGARVEDLVDRFQAGDSVAEIATDFSVPSDEVEDVIRLATRPQPEPWGEDAAPDSPRRCLIRRSRLSSSFDRSLGKSVVEGLRDAGLTVAFDGRHLRREARPASRRRGLAAKRQQKDRIVLTKDDAIRRRPAERDALTEAAVRVFCLTKPQHARCRADQAIRLEPPPNPPPSPQARSVHLRRLCGGPQASLALIPLAIRLTHSLLAA